MSEESKMKLPKPKRGSVLKENVQNPQNMPGLTTRFKKAQVAEVIQQCHGLSTAICHVLDCTARQFQMWLRKHPDMKELQEECRLEMVDKAEQVLVDNMNSDNEMTRQKAAEFILTRLGYKRGWLSNQGFVGVTINNGEDQKSTIQAIFGIQPQEEQT